MIGSRTFLGLGLAWAFAVATPGLAQVQMGIGTQDTTSNTVTAGVVIREMKLLEKYLPKDAVSIEWQNFTSGPPVTNGMMANKLQIGAMGDYPLVVNGYSFQNNPESHSKLIAVAAYNLYGSGNGIVVKKDSPYYQLTDLKGKLLTVPFGSAAYGMVLKALQDKGLSQDYLQLASQAPEVGATNLQAGKIDAHADFVPFAELLPFRGYARKIYDGAETGVPTFHGVVVRADFAAKHPEIVVAFLKAKIEADNWVRAHPQAAAEKIAEWTKIEKEVIYIFLGPGGIMTLDSTLKPQLLDAAQKDAGVLRAMGKIKDFDVKSWADDSYLRQAYRELGLDYAAALKTLGNYEVSGTDPYCHRPVTEPRQAGEIWIQDGPIQPYSSAACTIGAMLDLQKQGRKIDVVYLFDHSRGIKLFANQAYFAIDKNGLTPFLLKHDAEAYAAASGGHVGDLAAAVAASATH